MIVDRIELVGFGRLSERALDFHPRVNVVCGPNEAGKSTLLEAIHALLYGFAESGNARDHNQKKLRYRPWSGGPYGGTLHVCLANGEKFRLVRDFAGETTRIYQDPGATDRTLAYTRQRHGWTSFANDHLGLTLPVFRACAHVDQAALNLEKGDVAVLKIQLERLADSAGTESSAQEAVQRLEDLLRARVNPRGFTANTSHLRKAQENVATLRDELNASRASLVALEALAAEERALVDKLADMGHARSSLEVALTRLDLRDVEDRVARLSTFDERIAALNDQLSALADVANVDREGLDGARSALDEIDRARREYAMAKETVDREAAERDAAKRELDELDRRLAGLAEVDLERLAAAETAINRWRDAESDLTSTEEALDQARSRLDVAALVEPRLDGLSDRATIADLANATRLAESTLNMVQLAEAEAMKVAVAPEIDEEFAVLDNRLEGLTTDRLEDLRERDQEISLVEAAGARSAIPLVVVLGVLAGLVGLTAGWFAWGVVGALVGGIALAVLGFAAGTRLQRLNADGSSRRDAGDRGMFAAELASFGATTVGDLQRAWDRRAEIGGDVQRARERRGLVVERRTAHVRALDDLERLIGTRDLGRASAILDALRQRQVERESVTIAVRQAEERVSRGQRTLAEQRQAASEVITPLGITADDLAVAQERLTDLRRQQFTRGSLRHRKAEVEAAVHRFEERLANVDRARQQLAETTDVARRDLAAVGVEGNESELRDVLTRRLERFETCQARLGERQKQLAGREALVRSDDPKRWERQRDALRERLLDLSDTELTHAGHLVRSSEETEARSAPADLASDGTAGVCSGDARSREELQQQLARVSGRCDEITRRLATIEGQRKAALDRVREPATVEEELSDAERRLAQLERLRGALEDARDLLLRVGEEHRRNFAPHLADGVGEALAQATANRYREVDVDPTDLKVRVRCAERLEPVSVEDLSQGTRDAVWLLLRASVVDLLSNGGEPVPLFFDDPLVHVDPDRCSRLLDVIQSLSENRQVFYFTQDQRVVNWAQACPMAAIHDMGAVATC